MIIFIHQHKGDKEKFFKSPYRLKPFPITLTEHATLSKNKMTARKNFNSSKVPRMTDVFPQAVIADAFIFVSGTARFNQTTGKLRDSFEEQARQAFENIKTILEELGSRLDNIVKTTVFMVSGNDFSILNKVYGDVFPENAPARSTPQVAPFPAGILISVECIALL